MSRLWVEDDDTWDYWEDHSMPDTITVFEEDASCAYDTGLLFADGTPIIASVAPIRQHFIGFVSPEEFGAIYRARAKAARRRKPRKKVNANSK